MAKEPEKASSTETFVGDTVLYALPDGPNAGQQRPAIVTRKNDEGSVNLHVFRDISDRAESLPDHILEPFHAERGSVNFSETNEPGTWNLRTGK